MSSVHRGGWIFWNINPLFAEKHWFIKAEFFHRPVLVLANLSAKHFSLWLKTRVDRFALDLPILFPIFLSHFDFVSCTFIASLLLHHFGLASRLSFSRRLENSSSGLVLPCMFLRNGESTLLWLFQSSPIESKSKSATARGWGPLALMLHPPKAQNLFSRRNIGNYDLHRALGRPAAPPWQAQEASTVLLLSCSRIKDKGCWAQLRSWQEERCLPLLLHVT